MTSYQVAIGHFNDSGLADFPIEPAQPDGIRYPEQTFSGDGSSGYAGFAFTELVWNVLLDRADVTALLAACGLANTLGGETPSNRVTLRLLDNDDTWIVVNATLAAPANVRRSMLGWGEFRLVANRLVTFQNVQMEGFGDQGGFGTPAIT